MDLEPGRAGGDRQPLIAELADDVERLARRLLEREPQLVGRDRALDLRAHVRGRLEVTVGRDEPVERLVRALEIIVADEVIEPALRVDDVREHGAAEELVPQGLPEAFDLAERLGMLRPAADVLHAHAREQLLELRLAAPHRVLPAVVGQHLGRLAVRRDATVEGLHHERRPLVMCERVTDHEAAVVVHEHAHVQPLGAPQPEREDVRLPQLVGHRALEAARRVLAGSPLGRGLHQPFFVQDAPHHLFAHAQRLEARQHVPDPPRPPLLVLALELHDLLAHRRCLQRPQSGVRTLGPVRLQRGRAVSSERGRPLLHRAHRHTERLRHLVFRRPLQPLLHHCQLVLGRDLPTTAPLLLLARHLVSRSADSVGGWREASAR